MLHYTTVDSGSVVSRAVSRWRKYKKAGCSFPEKVTASLIILNVFHLFEKSSCKKQESAVEGFRLVPRFYGILQFILKLITFACGFQNSSISIHIAFSQILFLWTFLWNRCLWHLIAESRVVLCYGHFLFSRHFSLEQLCPTRGPGEGFVRHSYVFAVVKVSYILTTFP